MTPKPTEGMLALAKKTLAVLSSGIISLLNTQARAGNPIKGPQINKDPNESGKLLRLILKPKLILKQNRTGIPGYFLSMHASYSSHSSHSSHASSSSGGGHYSHSLHASHSSHYSSSPSYTPSNTAPYTRARVVPVPKHHTSPYSTYSSKNKTLYTDSQGLPVPVLTRVLYKGCEAYDVQALQKILVRLGYNILVTAYFGEKTEQAVISFHQENELKPDGRVGEKTFSIMQNKLP